MVRQPFPDRARGVPGIGPSEREDGAAGIGMRLSPFDSCPLGDVLAQLFAGYEEEGTRQAEWSGYASSMRCSTCSFEFFRATAKMDILLPPLVQDSGAPP